MALDNRRNWAASTAVANPSPLAVDAFACNELSVDMMSSTLGRWTGNGQSVIYDVSIDAQTAEF
jgi:hypothetical protein